MLFTHHLHSIILLMPFNFGRPYYSLLHLRSQSSDPLLDKIPLPSTGALVTRLLFAPHNRIVEIELSFRAVKPISLKPADRIVDGTPGKGVRLGQLLFERAGRVRPKTLVIKPLYSHLQHPLLLFAHPAAPVNIDKILIALLGRGGRGDGDGGGGRGRVIHDLVGILLPLVARTIIVTVRFEH
ncbi:hypothetical protein BDR22DRAFT_49439 [Usnea florida]